MKRARVVVLLGVIACVGAAFLNDAAFAQKGGKPAAKPTPTAKPVTTAKPPSVVIPKGKKDGGAGPGEAALPPPTVARDAGAGGGGVISGERTLDGGAKVFRFGELEVEGRLRSPQLVYFLRRVRAEFAAGDLGHRSFMLELSQTRQSDNF